MNRSVPGPLSVPGASPAVLLACGFLLSCASGGTGTAPDGGVRPGRADESAATSGGVFVRRVRPFPVLAADGEPYAFPFLGGFDVPRPQLVDLDGDGDLDLVIQEYTGRLMAFERVGGTAPWRLRPDLLTEVDVGEWYRFVDYDADGDPDLLAEEPFSYVRLFRNRGAGSHPPAFETAADTLRDTAGAPIYSDRQNIPNAADLDCNARLDLLVGRTVGTITRFEAADVMAAAPPTFNKLTDAFEGIQITGSTGPQLPPGSMHGANTMALADHDGDGDLDLFWGDFFEPGLLLIENTGTCEQPVLTSTPRPFPLEDPIRTSGYNAPTFGDLDGDGSLDLLVGVLGGAFNSNATTVANLLHLERIETGWELRTTRFVTQLDVGNESVPALFDADGDGALDLLLANKVDPTDLGTSIIHVFAREGGADGPAWREQGTLGVTGSYHQAPAFGDLDGDGDADVVLGTFRDRLRFLRNEGIPGPGLVLVDSAYVTLTRGSNAMPALGDLDGDGDLDLLVGEASGTINYYRNEGTPTLARFELVSDEYGGIDVERRSAPALADLDGDGDLDLLVGSERQGVRFWRNEGNREEPRFVETDPVLTAEEVLAYSVPLPADLDGDGDLDLLVGGLGGGLLYFENTTR